jgi:AbrB family looped-hinge helix DNA binding protein
VSIGATVSVATSRGRKLRRPQFGSAPLATVGQKGQIVIPVAVRRQLGLRPGREVFISIEDGRIILEPLPADLIEYLSGSLKSSGKSMLQEHLEEHAEEIRRDEEGRS